MFCTHQQQKERLDRKCPFQIKCLNFTVLNKPFYELSKAVYNPITLFYLPFI